MSLEKSGVFTEFSVNLFPFIDNTNIPNCLLADIFTQDRLYKKNQSHSQQGRNEGKEEGGKEGRSCKGTLDPGICLIWGKALCFQSRESCQVLFVSLLRKTEFRERRLLRLPFCGVVNDLKTILWFWLQREQQKQPKDLSFTSFFFSRKAMTKQTWQLLSSENSGRHSVEAGDEILPRCSFCCKGCQFPTQSFWQLSPQVANTNPSFWHGHKRVERISVTYNNIQTSLTQAMIPDKMSSKRKKNMASLGGKCALMKQ